MSFAFRRDDSGRWLALIAALAAIAVVAALVSQHLFDFRPCAWCVLQRTIFMLIALAAGLGLAVRGVLLRRLSGGLVLLLAGCGSAAALWQHFVAAKSASCDMSLADRLMGATGLNYALPEVFAAYASCADAASTLAGLPYEAWSLGLFVLLGIFAVLAMRGAR